MSLKFVFALSLLSSSAYSQTATIPSDAKAVSEVPGTQVAQNQVTPAASVPPKKTRKKRKSDNQSRGFISDSRKVVSDRVILLANKVDGLFGNSRALDEYYSSSLKLTTGVLYNANTGEHENTVSTSLILSLPNLKAKERAFNDYWNRKPGEAPAPMFDEDFITPEEFKEQNPWDFATETGIRWTWPVGYYGKLRASRNYLTGNVVHHLLDEIGWDSQTYWASKVSLASDYAYSRYFLLRFVNEANWYMSEPSVFGTTQGPSWIYSFQDKSLFSFDLRFNMRSIKLEMYTDAYTVGFTYRTGFKKVNWIFVEISPLCAWKYDDGFAPTTTINLSLDILFGKEKTAKPKSDNPLDM
ncbi:hypothetical protein DOM22_16445 [Bdellovibrio sp. ZAP7]|uniref:hypothetical protein n=1 Tax=Bdellovibrio sp. ZAP7 TaxID=2231053 RepID=UPI00115B53B4|nr:hypothetical protein [Bdellovibrio sp. ZAP7]QDK46631.1 hypothetical protein DOM22_16445 [Bdellovibrio sp. ZAP7]